MQRPAGRSRCAPTRGSGRLDRGDDARATELGATADLLDGLGSLEKMEAGLVVGQKRRADVADSRALADGQKEQVPGLGSLIRRSAPCGTSEVT